MVAWLTLSELCQEIRALRKCVSAKILYMEDSGEWWFWLVISGLKQSYVYVLSVLSVDA